MYPNLLSVVAINTTIQSWKGKGLFHLTFLGHSLLLREARAGDQGRNLGQKLQRNKRNEACCLVNWFTVSQLSYIAQIHLSWDSIAQSGLGYLISVFNQDNLSQAWPQASRITEYFNRLSLKPVAKTMGRCSDYNFEESKSKDCFHMVPRKYAFSDLIRMKWRIGILTQVRGSETLLFSIEMLLQHFDCLSVHCRFIFFNYVQMRMRG